jgi:hypothetical protein
MKDNISQHDESIFEFQLKNVHIFSVRQYPK